MSDLNMQLVLRLIDRATGPAKAALQKVEQAGAAMETSGRRNIALADRMAEKNRARSAALQGEAAQVIGLGVALWGLTEPAIQAEARMAEVSKVVDFEDANGFKLLQRDISALVTSGGLAGTANGMMDIIAAAGRMGVVDENLPDAEKRKQLLAFAEDATKMSVAFGISADDAGTTLARWRENLNLSHDQAMALADTVNFLGNTMATNEADILQVINRQGVVAKTAGLAENEIAALSATILAAGASPEIAATGMKNFTNALVKGENLTKRQRGVFQELGIDAEQMAVRMQTDATGGIMSVLEAFQQVDAHRRNALVGALFGEEAKGAIMPLIANTDMLRQSFENTADATAHLGLMEEEYRRQAETTLAQRRRLLQYLNAVSTTIGSALLPMLNELMETIMPVIGQITEWAAQNPELIEQLGWVVAGLFGFKLASLALRFALLPLFSVVGGGVRAFGLMQLALATLAGRSPLKLGSLVKPLIWGPALIPKLTKAAWVAMAVGSKLAVSALVKPLAWGARHVPPINWVARAGTLSWTRLIRPLVWGAALIPKLGVAAWTILAVGSRLAVAALVKPLVWAASLIPKLTKAKWIARAGGKFALSALVTPLKWTAALLPNFAPALARFVRFRIASTAQMAMLSASAAWHSALIGGKFAAGLGKFLLRGGAIGTGVALGLGIKPVANGELTPEVEAGADNLTQEDLDKASRNAVNRQKAERTAPTFLERLGLARPAAAPSHRLEGLRAEADALRTEIAALEEKMAGPLTPPNALALPETRDKLEAKREELEALQSEIDRTKARADTLEKSFETLGATTVAPEINSASIDRALDKVRRLSQGLRALPGGEAAATVSDRVGTSRSVTAGPKPDGARALGGAVRAGFTYRINELGEELFTPSTNGRVTPAREAAPLLAAAAAFGGNAAAFGALPARAAAVMTAASLGLGLAGPGAEAAPAFTTDPATQDARPAVRIVAPAPGARPGVTVRGTAPTAPTSRSVTMTVGDIHVHTAPGQSPEAIAEAVMERIDRARRRADDALHDGGDYD